MNKIILAAACLLCTLNTQANDIVRHQLGSWEADIGYSAVVESHNQLHISGVACAGENMDAAVSSCYKEIEGILKKFNLTFGDIVKETIYTLDIEALKRAIPVRKAFYNNQFPAASWIQISRLYNPDQIVEIELVANLPAAKTKKKH